MTQTGHKPSLHRLKMYINTTIENRTHVNIETLNKKLNQKFFSYLVVPIKVKFNKLVKTKILQKKTTYHSVNRFNQAG